MTNYKLILITLGVFLFAAIWIYSNVFSLNDYYTTMTCFIVFGGAMYELGKHARGVDENN